MPLLETATNCGQLPTRPQELVIHPISTQQDERLTMAESSSSGAAGSAQSIAIAARHAFEASQLVDPTQRNVALQSIHSVLVKRKEEVLVANKQDMEVRRCLDHLYESSSL